MRYVIILLSVYALLKQEMAHWFRWRGAGERRPSAGESRADSFDRHRQRRVDVRRSARRRLRRGSQDRLSSAARSFGLHDTRGSERVDQYQQSADVRSGGAE